MKHLKVKGNSPTKKTHVAERARRNEGGQRKPVPYPNEEKKNGFLSSRQGKEVVGSGRKRGGVNPA